VRLREAAFEAAPAAQLVVDRDGIVVLANGQLRQLFRVETKDVGKPFQDLELSYRPADLRSAIDQVLKERRAVQLSAVERPLTGGEAQYFDIDVAPLSHDGDAILGVRVAFQDVTHGVRLQAELQRSNQELETANE